MRQSQRRIKLGLLLVACVLSLTRVDCVRKINRKSYCNRLYPELPFSCTQAACQSCPAGSGVAKYCNGSTSTVCENCTVGVNYSSTSNPTDTCRRVTECPDDKVVVKQATAVSETQCGCPKGYRPDSAEICHPFTPTRATSQHTKATKESRGTTSTVTRSTRTRKTTATATTTTTTTAHTGSSSLVIPIAAGVGSALVVIASTIIIVLLVKRYRKYCKSKSNFERLPEDENTNHHSHHLESDEGLFGSRSIEQITNEPGQQTAVDPPSPEDRSVRSIRSEEVAAGTSSTKTETNGPLVFDEKLVYVEPSDINPSLNIERTHDEQDSIAANKIAVQFEDFEGDRSSTDYTERMAYEDSSSHSQQS